MKTICFADTKRPILTFVTSEVELGRDGDAILLQAGGEITFQDMPALEELMYVKDDCLLSVHDGEKEMLHGRFHVTFLVLEPDQLVARISVGE